MNDNIPKPPRNTPSSKGSATKRPTLALIATYELPRRVLIGFMMQMIVCGFVIGLALPIPQDWKSTVVIVIGTLSVINFFKLIVWIIAYDKQTRTTAHDKEQLK